MPRRFAISDIHGCYDTFLDLLNEIQLSPNDELYLLGDFVDRGPRTRKVLDHIIRLQQEDYRISALRGNHDQYMLDAVLIGDKSSLRSWKNAGGGTTRSSYVTSSNPQGRLDPAHLLWLNDLPYYFVLDDYIMVHAGLNFRRKNPLKGKKAMLYRRNWYRQIDYKWLGNRTIIHGHTPLTRAQVEAQVSSPVYPVFDIDAGCFHVREGMGNLCAFDLDQRTFTFVNNQDR